MVFMIIMSRTPFRLPLGGGSTDLPAYYQKFGGFIFGVAVNIYMDVFVRRPIIDDNIHFQYTRYEIVSSRDLLLHDLGREALALAGIDNNIDVVFKAETPAGTGLGSSGSCAVGLLHALYAFKGRKMTQADLAEQSFQITQRLNWPDGKQDPYLAALGGFTVLEISQDGAVHVSHPPIQADTINKFLRQTLIFYTGIRRRSFPILLEQSRERALELKHRTKDIGKQILAAFTRGNLDDFGRLLNEHWQVKKGMSDKISSEAFDEIYDLALQNGALGGKILGAGGGGYFMFYCRGEAAPQLVRVLAERGLRHIPFDIDYQGTRVNSITI